MDTQTTPNIVATAAIKGISFADLSNYAEEVKRILGDAKKKVEDAGVILDDSELDKVAGGSNAINGHNVLTGH